ncbi:MAG: L-seryl-tRNA(Sec) selenium transferase, partial [Gemmataceae bacterium]
AAAIVNNCAAATVLTLRALAVGREVIVSRGQLIEIGGGFRMPDIMATSGALLREVGTTNITRRADYERAITPNTALILRVHTSNYRIRGHTSTPSLAELIELGRKHQIPVIDDLGSGAMEDFAPIAPAEEPGVLASIAAGACLTLFSADKLLGGPQAGIILGRRKLVEKCLSNDLMRAVRPDKFTLAALQATLELDAEAIPVRQMLLVPPGELRRRTDGFQEALGVLPGAITQSIETDTTFAGGGSWPDHAIPTVVLVLRGMPSAEGFASLLRLGSPPVIGRVHENTWRLDLRTIRPADEPALIQALIAAAHGTVATVPPTPTR